MHFNFTRETGFFHIFILASQLWTYKKSSNSWNEFHIQRQIMGYSLKIFFSEPIYTKSWIKHLLEKVGINGHALFQLEIKIIKDFLIKSFWFLSLLTIYIIVKYIIYNIIFFTLQKLVSMKKWSVLYWQGIKKYKYFGERGIGEL